MATESNKVGKWNLGFGSNMNVKHITEKKGVKILDHTAAILKDFRLDFMPGGQEYVEPAAADVIESPGSEVHGMAILLDKEAEARMDQHEVVGFGYRKKYLEFEAYDGRKLEGYVYYGIFKSRGKADERPPSKRYMNLLIRGARESNLKPEYIAGLEKVPTYSPPEHILKLRLTRPDPNKLRPISMEELSEHGPESDEYWCCMLGYVVRPNVKHQIWFQRFKNKTGRDTTSRALMHFHGINLKSHDDGGRPPYPLVSHLNADELEYLTQYLDNYQAGVSSDGVGDLGEIIGFLQEFKEQQYSGKTDFKLPKV